MTSLYKTSSTVSVFLNGFHIDQAYRIDYRENSDKVPIYGYNDIFYSKAVQSKTIIQGMLVVNFVYSGYLNRAILFRETSKFVPSLYNYKMFGNTPEVSGALLTDSIRKSLPTELPPNTQETKASRAEFIANLIAKPSERARTKDALNRFFSVTKSREINDNLSVADIIAEDEQSTFVNTNRIDNSSALTLDGALPKGSTIDIYYQDPKFTTWLARFTNVYFTDISQQVSQAGAEGSSEPLYEIYSFIASKREIVLIK